MCTRGSRTKKDEGICVLGEGEENIKRECVSRDQDNKNSRRVYVYNEGLDHKTGRGQMCTIGRRTKKMYEDE